jgi:hypothetical protein
MGSEHKGLSAGVRMARLETADGESVDLKGMCSLGRCASSDLVLAGEKVSRKHALIQARDDDEFWLSDLNSSNGTYLNGRRVGQTTRLYDQDRIAIGPHRLSFRQPGSAPRPSAEGGLAEGTLCDGKAEFGWLLLVNLESPTRVAQSLAAEKVPTLMARWQDECRESIERHGGKVSVYLTDGFVAFWQDRHAERATVARALSELKRFQARSQTPFFLMFHYGQVTMPSPGFENEQSISGPGLNFVLRAGKLAAALKTASLVSEVARALLGPHLSFHETGPHMVNGFEGEHRFYGL